MTDGARDVRSAPEMAWRQPDRRPGTQEDQVRVEVDRGACEANAVCAGLVPEVFDLDDDDRLHIQVEVVPPRLADTVRRAVASCPKAALRIVP